MIPGPGPHFIYPIISRSPLQEKNRPNAAFSFNSHTFKALTAKKHPEEALPGGNTYALNLSSGTYWAFHLVVYAFLIVIVGITILNIVNSISMSVSARMKQYGILRAIGMDDAQLKRMISAEAGTYAVSGLVVGIALGLVLNRKLYILLITHYFGAAWQVPWGCLAVIVVVVLAAVVLAVYNPVRRILMQPITATISEL